jgi:hypothetical protein
MELKKTLRIRGIFLKHHMDSKQIAAKSLSGLFFLSK